MVDDILSEGGQAIAVQADITSQADVQRLFDQAWRKYGRLDVLVNNAGVFHFEPLRDITPDEFHRQFNVNVLGVILTTQKALEYFGTQGGSVVNISSIASRNPVANSVVYASSKAAVDTITLALAKELGPRGIRVNAIAPGGVATEGTRANGVVGSDEERRIVGLTPLGRFGEPQDIAKVAAFLASDQSAWVTGERISVSGGWL